MTTYERSGTTITIVTFIDDAALNKLAVVLPSFISHKILGGLPDGASVQISIATSCGIAKK